jgi:hypothetical protein
MLKDFFIVIRENLKSALITTLEDEKGQIVIE